MTVVYAAASSGSLSAGMLNGKRLTPNRRGLPPILVKGSFRRDFVVVEEKFNKEGALTGSVRVQRPKLTLHALRLDTLRFLELRSGSLPSGAQDLEDFNSADLVEAYGESLGRLRGENPMAAAEVGTGKSTVSLSIAGCLAPEHFAQTVSELRRLGFDTSGLRPIRSSVTHSPLNGPS